MKKTAIFGLGSTGFSIVYMFLLFLKVVCFETKLSYCPRLVDF